MLVQSLRLDKNDTKYSEDFTEKESEPRLPCTLGTLAGAQIRTLVSWFHNIISKAKVFPVYVLYLF